MTENEKILLANVRNTKTPTIFILTPFGGATVKDADTPLSHAQGLFIQVLEHGKNKGRFTETIKELRWNWSRGWWHPCPYNFDDGLRAKFDACNNN